MFDLAFLAIVFSACWGSASSRRQRTIRQENFNRSSASVTWDRPKAPLDGDRRALQVGGRGGGLRGCSFLQGVAKIRNEKTAESKNSKKT
jgi:hypothetical protein